MVAQSQLAFKFVTLSKNISTAVAKDILSNIKYATIATTDKHKPWNTPVFYVHDYDLNIYWSSLPTSVHSTNIAKSGQVFIVIYDSTSNKGYGLYIEASAKVVEGENEIRRVLKLISVRKNKDLNFESFLKTKQKIYKAIPSKIWLNDAKKDANGYYKEDFRLNVDKNKLCKIL